MLILFSLCPVYGLRVAATSVALFSFPAGGVVMGRPVVDAAEQVVHPGSSDRHRQDRLVVDGVVGGDEEQAGLVENRRLAVVDSVGDEQPPGSHLVFGEPVGQRKMLEPPLLGEPGRALPRLATDGDHLDTALFELAQSALKLAQLGSTRPDSQTRAKNTTIVNVPGR